MSMIQTFPTGSGSGSGSNNGFYKTTDTITATIDASTTLDITNIIGLTIADVIINETIIYDDLGTTAKVTAKDTTNNTIDVKTITLGGTTHYYVERDGQELLSAYASLDSDWTVVVNQKIPLIKRSGSINQSSTGSFTIPNGRRVEILFSLSQMASSGTSQPDVVYGLYNDTDSTYISSRTSDLKPIEPYNIKQYSYGHTLALQWVNDTGHDVNISIRPIQGTGANVRYYYTSLTIKEIGRLVDPVKYLDNSEGLQDTPVGNIISYMGNNVPRHYLACDGTIYNIGTYPQLEAHFVEQFGSVNYFGGNGTTTYAVPNLQGEFLRGTGTNGHTDQGDGANVGVHQDATEHLRSTLVSANGDYYVYSTNDQYVGQFKQDSMVGVTTKQSKYSGTLSSVTQSNRYTSRPTNTSVKYCIKYESTMQVILGNEQYKVEAQLANGGTKTWDKGGQNLGGTICTPTLLNGDSQMIDSTNKCFVAPVDGWYDLTVFMTMSTKPSTVTVAWIIAFLMNDNNRQLIRTPGYSRNAGNDAYGGVQDQMECSGTIYLNSGDQVQIGAWASANDLVFSDNARASFVLQTSSVDINEVNIIAADDVYSTDEQLVGSYLGKPLYKKTYSGLSVTTTRNVWTNLVSDVSALNIEKLVDSEVLGPGDYKTLTDAGVTQVTSSNVLQVYTSGYNLVIDTITIKYTKTTDTAGSAPNKNSLLLTRPDLWEVGTEYDFGGGLYGRRFTGTITVAANTTDTRVIANNIGSPRLVSFGGDFAYDNDLNTLQLGYSQVDNNSFCGSLYTHSNTGGGEIRLVTKTSYVRTNAPYDIWCTYTK